MIPGFITRWFTPATDSGIADDLRRGKSPWADSVHLLWSFWIFITPLFEGGLSGYTWRWLALTLVSYPVFLLLFFKAQLASRRTTHFYTLGMIALCLLLLRWYPSGVSYFIYGCIMMRAYNMRLRLYMGQLVLMNLLFIGWAWWLHYPTQLLMIIPATVFATCTIVMVEGINKEKNAALRLSHDEVRRLAATAERERIGRDLHDLLGHTLSLITLKLELSRKLFDRDNEAARREVEEAEKVARHALAEVRSAVTGIRATDLAAELASVRLLLESSRVHLDYGQPPADLPVDIERGLSLILREAVTNIARHADASSAKVEWLRERASVCMRICDDGRGGIDSDGNVTVPVPILRLVEAPRSAPAPSFAELPAAASPGQPAV